MTDAILEELNRAAMDDVVLLRRYPPEGVQTPNYFGDEPRLPDELDWPVSASTGNRMSFLAQIDLGSLPSAMQSRHRTRTCPRATARDYHDTHGHQQR